MGYEIVHSILIAMCRLHFLVCIEDVYIIELSVNKGAIVTNRVFTSKVYNKIIEQIGRAHV